MQNIFNSPTFSPFSHTNSILLLRFHFGILTSSKEVLESYFTSSAIARRFQAPFQHNTHILIQPFTSLHLSQIQKNQQTRSHLVPPRPFQIHHGPISTYWTPLPRVFNGRNCASASLEQDIRQHPHLTIAHMPYTRPMKTRSKDFGASERRTIISGSMMLAQKLLSPPHISVYSAMAIRITSLDGINDRLVVSKTGIITAFITALRQTGRWRLGEKLFPSWNMPSIRPHHLLIIPGRTISQAARKSRSSHPNATITQCRPWRR